MKKKYTFIILATLILSMGMVSCEKAVETIFGGETGDDGLHRGYSVKMYETRSFSPVSCRKLIWRQ